GNGSYAYIDSLFEARKVLVEQGGGTLVPIARDVKIQVEFNPARVGAYRLLGYENRMLRAEDFNDDTKDAGEIGAGQSVTALYELIPPGEEVPGGKVDELRYQKPAAAGSSDELCLVKLRYKEPSGSDSSKLLSFPVAGSSVAFEQASENLRFAASVASFGMILRQSEFKGSSNLEMVGQWASRAQGKDAEGYRAEFLKLVRSASGVASVKPE
ncbi:MAG: YfbK domain-containing protein, partial [Candidatus Eremiobacterota bacterium]